ncbi:sensor histidine kinase [Streptomyces coffeae]|uniref:histidine kinase n=1 Tax=Streptomyces coffeae TaxID=621382 RepID=A0ABS1NBE9_9ACTN|nr:HAMP domain-containing sensor histidine kinase [Streptomyces coffeae]MBL1097408.1 HAMP domain-containing histidine kinase [Streptomyces coffeae]
MKRFRPRLGGLRTRLVIAFVLVALISTVTATALAYRESRTAVLTRTQDAFQADFRDRVDSIAPDFDTPPDVRTLTTLADSVSSGLSGAPLVVARYHDLTASSDGLADRTRITPELRASVRSSGHTRFQRVEYRGEPYLVVGTPVTYDDGRVSGLEVFAVTSLRAEEEHTAALLDSVRGGLLPVLGLAALLALLAAGTVLRPVRELGRATRRLAEGDLDSRVEVKGRDELAGLAADFNTTADALQRSVNDLRDQEARARRFVADVSHELRTPLTAMTMVTTVLDEDAAHLPADAARAARTVSDETARLARLVEDLMEMSRFDSGAARLDAADTDLAQTIRGTLELRGWTDQVEACLPEGVRAVVDRRRVDVAVANLVGNALRHGEQPVTVTLSADTDRVTVQVTDRGPGLPPDTLAQVFDRFYKADSARTRSEGSGLGTAIALENARLHGGTIEAGNRPAKQGGGAVFTLRLPRHREVPDGRGTAADGGVR